MVIMISTTGLASPAGSMAKRWSSKPTITVATIARSAASGSGTPAAARNTVVMPPSMTNSPCAKLMTSEAL
jgi:hypothetical protein